MLCHGECYRADNNRYFIFSFHYVFLSWLLGQLFGQQEYLYLPKENHYSIGTFKEKSFVGKYVSDSLYLTFSL